MTQLPCEFTEKMQRLLGDAYEAFLASYGQPRRFGLRVNTLKISTEEFERLAPFHLTKIPWVENGYYYEEQDAPARHPFYYAGLYYLQEPSAMTPASVLPVQPGERVLDLCAAPGGKATELGAKLRGRGLLVANDVSASRAKALLKNIEVFGITNAFVTNETPAHLAEQFPEFFDKIVVDAPCSGEGMFRKDPAVIKAWDAQKPSACAKQQREIVRRAADMLAPGGMLLYSTCTFSPEENEQIVAGLLAERTDLELLDIPWYEGFAHGIPEAAEWDGQEKCAGRSERPSVCGSTDDRDGRDALCGTPHEAASGADGRCDLRKCVRIFPHRMAGEGHFLALLRKKGGPAGTGSGDRAKAGTNTDRIREDGASEAAGRTQKDGKIRQSRKAPRSVGETQQVLLAEFWKSTFALWDVHALSEVSALPDTARLEIRKGQAYYIPEYLDNVRGLAFLRNGLYLGEIKKDRFEPSQSLAMALGRARTRDAADDGQSALADAAACVGIGFGDVAVGGENEFADAAVPGRIRFIDAVNLDWRDERVLRYLRGETIEVGESGADGSAAAGAKGWRLVCVNGYPLGWGKLSGGILKNKYHAGWRMK